jgi:hypothetical protein
MAIDRRTIGIALMLAAPASRPRKRAMRWAVLFVCGALTGCRFDLPEEMGAIPPDGPPADARLCFGSGLGALCLPSGPAMPRNLSGTLDTGIDSTCGHLVDVTGVQTCVIVGTTIDIATGVRVRAIGTRPLLLVAAGALTIAGELDAGSQRAGASGPGAPSGACAGLVSAAADNGGGGGGAGGSFVGAGGNGGIGDSGDSATPAGSAHGGAAAGGMVPTVLRAGCRGGIGGDAGGGSTSGAAGRGGGAVYLIAGTEIQISGLVTAYGGGGGGGDERAGGGGGGSGGMIGLDAPVVTVAASGVVAANGGGGGEGGGPMMTPPGGNGSDGTSTAGRAAGGSGGLGGNGGAGSGGSADNGNHGADDSNGGGGGGGGAGFIYVRGALTSNGLVSPAPSLN